MNARKERTARGVTNSIEAPGGGVKLLRSLPRPATATSWTGSGRRQHTSDVPVRALPELSSPHSPVKCSARSQEKTASLSPLGRASTPVGTFAQTHPHTPSSRTHMRGELLGPDANHQLEVEVNGNQTGSSSGRSARSSARLGSARGRAQTAQGSSRSLQTFDSETSTIRSVGMSLPLGLGSMGTEDLAAYVKVIRDGLERDGKLRKHHKKAAVQEHPEDNLSSGSVDASSDAPLDESPREDTSIFRRSKTSKVAPLRTLLLDSRVNNFPQAKTQSEFLARLKHQNIPHESFDVDGDGVVSQEDYRLAKMFDLDGNGVLDIAEQSVGRRIIAEEFFTQHEKDLHLYGPTFVGRSTLENVDKVSKSNAFQRVMSVIREREKHYEMTGSANVGKCLTSVNPQLTRYNWYNNKFDSTAWNDFTRDPRQPEWLASRQHDGSRLQLEFMRKAEARERAQSLLNASYDLSPQMSTKRVQLITNMAVENS